MLEGAKAKAARLFERLKQKSFRYWLSAIVVFLLGEAASQPVYDFLRVQTIRDAYFQFLLDHGPRPIKPGFISLVLINDAEYWTGMPAGRVPVNREYLAKVIDGLVASNASVIAIDFDTRLPKPDSLEIPKEYEAETCKLISAIRKGAAAGKKFVLATPISFDEQRRYRRDSDIYQSNGLCERPNQQAPKQCRENFTTQEKANVRCGHIALPYDFLALAPWIETTDGKLDSFALAIAKAEKPALVDDALWKNQGTVRYSSYIREAEFKKAGVIFSTDQFLDNLSKPSLHNTAVIVGANWRSNALGRGAEIDRHKTPIGELAGAVIHANYAEAVLDRRTSRAVPPWVAKVIEALFSMLAAVILAVISGLWQKAAALAALLVTLLLLQWAVLHGLAVFFDALFPVFCLGLHSLYERVLGMHDAAEVKN